MTSDEEKELLNLTRENNILLKQIYTKLDDLTNPDNKLKSLATSFGIGICSNIVGDRLLGLGR